MNLESIALALAIALATPVGQSEELNIKLGQEVWISRALGRPVHGHVEAITPEAVILTNAQRTTILPADIVKIQVRDRVWEGALAGAAVGITAGVFAPGRCDDGKCIPEPIILYGAIGAGIGALLDSITPRRVVYRAAGSRRPSVSVGPMLGPTWKGMTVQLRWGPRLFR